ncbi:POTRA domain protein, FtsQ-type [Gemella haemolysans]|jgi:potra domain protein, ftsq-type family|uniref:POTRA domain protein, FtsQ-type n=1 Tax=Gemella haemolysans TaxID=1379 RepID=A0A134A3E5_9BACL|nr:FtsQ-type POTRA domain-containing protein [Gemella haemolysans]KXB62225.1 POTRA domain protein, FtsQ-type [Gemella haemolysans]
MNKKNQKLLTKINNEKRRSSLEKIKRKKRRELIFIVTLFLIVIAVFTLLFSNYLKLKTIDVEGNNQITKEEILEAGNINNNLRTWSIKDEEIQKNIQSRFEIFKSVSVQSKLPSTIKVKVEEYNFIAQNKKEDGSIEIIMENGIPYSGKIRNNYNLPILENFKDDSDKLDEIYRNLNNLKEEVRLQISEIINDDGDNITIYMKDGQKVKALRASFSDKLNYYDEISKYIEDKNNTTLNLINGAYLETPKSEKRRNDSIKQLLARQGLKDEKSSKSNKEESEETEVVEKNNKTENSTTNYKTTTSKNIKNTEQQSVNNNKNE